MLYRNKYLMIIPALLLAMSCTKTEPQQPEPVCGTPVDSTECSGWGPAIGLVSITGPTTVALGQSIILSVTVTGTNGCAQYATLNGTVNNNNITLTGNVWYVGCMCTQALTELNVPSYSFTPTQAGTYTFQGVTYEGAPVTHTVSVQ